MEFKINSKDLENILSKTVLVIPNHSTIETLEYFLFSINNSNLVIQGTDSTSIVSAEVDNFLDTGKEIEFLVPAKLLYDFVKSLDDVLIKFNIEEDENRINITFDNGEYNISFLPKDEYHEMPVLSNDKVYTFDGKSLKRALDIANFAASKDDIRPALTGILFEFNEDGLNVVATDGHRLVKYTNLNIKNTASEQFVVPGKAVNILMRSLTDAPVEIILGTSQMTFKLGGNTITTRIINEKYPNYNSVIPLQNEKILKVNTKTLQKAVRRSMLFGNQIKLGLEANMLVVSSDDSNRGRSASEKLVCEYNDEPMSIGFQAEFINEMLSQVESEEVIFKINQPTKAVIIKPNVCPEGEDLLLLLMPIRLNN